MKHTKKRIAAFLLATALLIGLLPQLSQRSSAEDDFGSWGDNLNFHFYEETGLLEFTGTGDMYGSASPAASPWYEYRERITAISFPDGMTGIGANTFNDCTALTEITVPESVTFIDAYAFSGCISLSSITIQNATCDIFRGASTVGIPGTTVIHGYIGSTAQEYAYYYGYTFVSLNGDTPPAPESISIDEEHFPDDSFREYVRGFDGDEDGDLDYSERVRVTEIACTENGIASLEGIGFFPALTQLYCGGNQITVLDVSENTALTTLSCDNNQLTELDLSLNTALRHLSCSDNQLTGLDVRSNTALNSLNCAWNRLSELDLSRNTELTDLNCTDNQLTGLDVRSNTALNYLVCAWNQLTELDLSRNTALEELSCESNQLTALDVSNNTALLRLRCFYNQIIDLDISQNAFLEGILLTGELDDFGYHAFSKSDDSDWYCLEFDYMTTVLLSDGSSYYENPYETMGGVPIDAEHFPDESFRVFVQEYDMNGDGFLNDEELSAVTAMNCSWHGRTSIEGIEYFTALEVLDCSWNNLETLDVSMNTALTTLYCGRNQLTNLDLSQNTALTELYCYSNQLTELDLSENTALTNLSCGGNQLTVLDLSENTALTNLSCGGNQLTELDLSENPALTELICSGNQLTTLNVGENTALTKLNCDNNQLTTLDLSTNTVLELLSCGDNQLTVLDLSSNTGLTSLECYSNRLTTLNVRINTGLTFLSCYSNQLTALDVGPCTELDTLYSHANQIKELDISANPKLSNAVLNGTKDTSLAGINYFYKGKSAISFDQLTTVRLPNGQIYRTPIAEIFIDVKDSAYFADAVRWAAANGITSGTGNGSFSPNRTCTREQAMTFLYGAAGKPEHGEFENSFTDVPLDSYFYHPVMWAVEKKITGGMSDTLFGVGKPCTREQAVTFLWKAAGSPEPESTESPFTDVKSGKYYFKAVLWAVENGVTGGIGGGLFGVGRTCTRAQIVTFLYKAYAE